MWQSRLQLAVDLCQGQDFTTVIDEFCQHVKSSPCRSLSVASLNLGTSQPRHGVFECLRMAPEGLGNESQKMPNFSPTWHGPPLVVFLLSTLAPKWAAWTLTLCTQHCAPVSHLHAPQQNSTSTCFSTAYEVPSCSTQLLTARTVGTKAGKFIHTGVEVA